MHIKVERLNELEQQIHETISEVCQEQPNLTITQAAQITGVSASKISKMVKKLGFQGYKEYLRFLTGQELVKQKKMSSEFSRIKDFMENFDEESARYLAQLINQADKIILLGYGPTEIAMEYFEYKLNYTVNKNVIHASQATMIPSLLTAKSLVLVFSVAGKFAQFDQVFEVAKAKHAKAVLVLEELNTELAIADSEIIYLTKSQQDPQLAAHEKTRTIFFLFIEEIIRNLRNDSTNQND